MHKLALHNSPRFGIYLQMADDNQPNEHSDAKEPKLNDSERNKSLQDFITEQYEAQQVNVNQ